MPTLWPSVKMYRLLICCLAWAIIGNIYITGQIMSDTPLDRTSQVLNTLMSLYDKRIRPHTNGSATEVTCNMYIISLDSVKEATMEYGMTILFTQKWVDSRLAFNVSILNGIDKITIAHDVCWVPDLYFTNVKEGSFHQVTVENRFIETNHLGHVTLSMKLTLILSCYMDFRRFPMDQQECGMDIESYQYGSDNLVVKWRDENPIRKKPDVRLPQFSISPMITRNCSHDMYETGQISCIGMTFVMSRGIGFYLLQTYLPSVLIVVLSWMSFWIDITSTPARVTLCTTTVLTMTTTSVGNIDGLPKVSYIKAIDIWFAACLSFIVGISFEYAIVNYFWTRERSPTTGFKDIKISKMWRQCIDAEMTSSMRSDLRERRDSTEKSHPFDTSRATLDGEIYGNRSRRAMEVRVSPEPPTVNEFEIRTRQLARDIDRTARWGFPMAFILFIIVYFSYYLRGHNVFFE